MIVSAVIVVLAGAVATALLVVRLSGGDFSPASNFSPQLPAQVGQSLTINGVTVTLTSATVTQDTSFFGDTYQTAHLALHCWNQSNYFQSVSTANWRLYIDGGYRPVLFSVAGLFLFARHMQSRRQPNG
jgi:hypothetical protein